MARRPRRPPRPGALSELRPLRILTQIAVLQAIWYAAAIVLQFFNCIASGMCFSFRDLVLGWEAVRGDTTQGFVVGMGWVLDGGVVMVIAMVLLISRSKLVPDFALTTHFLHLCVVTFVTGSVPRNALWWMTMAVSATLSVILGIYGCRRRELEPISFGGGGGSGSGSTSGGGGSANGNGATAPSSATEPSDGLLRPADGDEEQGYSRGRGRGRGRDGAGEYEMVGLKPKVDGNRRTD